ncbi:MAG: histidine phosphatase family protein [Chloroflexota bacterium]|nr:histidine phosphatase family protein [Chloroflexota bacterium]
MPRRIYFIRHAAALAREVWHHADRGRPLNEHGYHQADELGRMLRAARIERVVSSPALRCIDTVWPLAKMLRLPITKDDALFEGASARAALALIRRTRARRAALCTHGDVMERVLGELVRSGVHLEGGVRLAKGAYWVFDLDDDGVSRAVYHRAP